MALKECDLYKHDLRELAHILLDIQSGKCQPYIGAVVAVYRKYKVKDGAWRWRDRTSVRFRPYVYRVDGRRLRAVWTRKSGYSSEYSARTEARIEAKHVGGVLFEGTIRWSLHNMSVSVMAAGLNEIHIPGPSF
jgi:hypothetical protein